MKRYTVTGFTPVNGKLAICDREFLKTAEEAHAAADAMHAALPGNCTVMVAEYHVIRTIGPRAEITVEDVLG